MSAPPPDRSAPEIRVERTDSGDEEQESTGRDGDRQGASVWEWIVAGVSTLLVLGLIGFILYEALAVPSGPPRIEITVDSIAPSAGGYLVEFSARNTGRTTARSLLVEGELRSDTGSVETAEATIDYVPAQARRRAGLVFEHDPRVYRLEIRPRGFDRP